MKAKKIISMFIVVAMITAMFAFYAHGSEGGQVYKFNFTTMSSEISVGGQAIKAWRDYVYEQSNGQIDITVYYSSTLVSEMDALPAIKDGLADMGEVVMAMRTDDMPLTTLLQTNFLDTGNALTFYDNVYKPLCEKYPEVADEVKGTVVVGNFVQVQGGTIHTAKKEVHVPEDLQGLTMHASSSYLAKWLSDCGANVIQLPASDWYSSFERGVADAMFGTWSSFMSMEIYKVLPYQVIFPHGTDTAFQWIFMNEDSYNSLPEDLQNILMDCFNYSTQAYYELDEQSWNETVETLEANGATVYTLTEEENELWVESAQGAFEEKIEGIKALGYDNVEEIYAYIEELCEQNQ